MQNLFFAESSGGLRERDNTECTRLITLYGL